MESNLKPEGATNMLCPACQVDLKMTDRQGVEVDYCPKCRGVWLDRGELDKILERTLAEMNDDGDGPRSDRRDRDRDRRDYRDDDDDYHRGRRRKSILSEILDF
jgi:hypothetical protein